MSTSLNQIANKISIQSKESLNEEDLTDVINKVAQNHMHKSFGYFTEEDIFSEVWIICLKQLQHYEPSRGRGHSIINSIERWLNKVVRNRLANLYRDKYSSVNADYRRARMNIMNSLPFDSVDISRESKGWGYRENLQFDLLYQEFFKFIEERLSVDPNSDELLDIYYDCLYSESVTSYYKNKLRQALIPIIQEWEELHQEDLLSDDREENETI